MKKNRLVYILAGLVIVVGVVAVLLITNGSASEGPNASSQANRSSSSSKSDNTQSTDAGTATTTEGTFDCLPPKGDGPQTLECAWGLRTDDGKVYELRADDPKPLSSIAMGSRIRVTGMITEASSTKYDTVGAIKVEKAEQL